MLDAIFISLSYKGISHTDQVNTKTLRRTNKEFENLKKSHFYFTNCFSIINILTDINVLVSVIFVCLWGREGAGDRTRLD
jgi:hypothetical protein